MEELKSINSNSNKLSLFGPIKDNYSIKKSQTQKRKGPENIIIIQEPKTNDSDSQISEDKKFQNNTTSLETMSDITTKENNNAAVELFTAINSKMVTNITADEISYLAPYISTFSFSADDIITIKGENVKNGKFEEFYVDDDDLYKTILEVFYEKVDNVG